jgi:hypothetical protein
VTFPSTPRDVLVEMKAGSTWVNLVTAGDVYTRDPIEIGRGRSDESSTAAPSYCKFTLNNADGKYSPRNPLSPYYGLIGRNTQLRVNLPATPVFDAASNHPTGGTGNLSWTHTPVGAPTGVTVMIMQYGSNANQVPSVTYGGVAMPSVLTAATTVGATNSRTYLFHLGSQIPTGPQTILVTTSGATLRQAGATSWTGGDTTAVNSTVVTTNTTTNPTIGITSTGNGRHCTILGAIFSDLDDVSLISSGSGYTQLFETDLGTEIMCMERAPVQVPGSFTISWVAGSNAYMIQGAMIQADNYRFFGEISSLPPRWDSTGLDAWVPVEAAGQLRRLGQGTDPAETGLRAYITPQSGLFRYWPLDGAAGTKYSLDIAPVWGGPTNFKFSGEGGVGNFTYGIEMGSPYLGNGLAFFNSNAYPMRGDVANGYPNWAFDFVFSTIENTAGMGSFTAVFHSYDGSLWSVNFNAGIAQVSYDDGVLGPIGFSPTGVLPALQDLDPHHVRFKVLQNGANTDWTLYIDGAVVDTGTQAGYVSSGLSVFRLYITRSAGQERINLAHLCVWADAASEIWPPASAVSQAAQGYDGEVAGTRIARITSLASIPLVMVGDPANTAIMGPQYSESKLTQLRDAEQADLGFLGEPRDSIGLLYRTRTSQYNQVPSLTLSYADGHLMLADFQPVDDDQYTRNDISVVRREGGNFRLSKTTGPLSTLEPPNGVGRYPDEVTVNVQFDALLQNIASWLLNRGTLDDARYPSIPVNLANGRVVADGLDAAVLATDIGDLLRITNAAAANIYADIDGLVLGYTEQILPREHIVRFVCGPAALYDVAVWGSGVGTGPDKYDTAGSTLTAGVSSTATSLSVATATGAPWTTVAGEFPFDIFVAGERMTVTNITSATSPQTFTVTRSVNGVVKAQALGASVRLWSTPRYAL